MPTKEKIKEVAIDLFYRKGYFASSLNDVAQEIGIRKASIYYHYPSKESLLLSILQTVLADLRMNLDQSLRNVEGAEQKMRAAVCSHVQFHIDRQKEVLISDSELRGLSPENYEAVIKARDDYDRMFQEIILEGMEREVWPKGDFKVLSYAILTMCTAVAIWYRPGGRLAKDKIAKIYEEFIVAALKNGVCPGE